MNPTVVEVITCLVIAAIAGPIGYWGLTNASSLTPGALPADERRRREAVLRRGAITCQVVAAIFLLAAIGRVLIV